MSLANFPTLQALQDDLIRLDARERARDARDVRDRVRLVDGKTLMRVDWGERSYWLDGNQRRVVRVLLEALGSRNPEVDQRTLIRASGVKGLARLADLFTGSRAWGELVIPGKQALHFRLPDPPEVQGEAERRIVPDEE